MEQSNKDKCIESPVGSGIFFYGPIISAGIWCAGLLAVMFAVSVIQGCVPFRVYGGMDYPDEMRDSHAMVEKSGWCRFLNWGCENGK